MNIKWNIWIWKYFIYFSCDTFSFVIYSYNLIILSLINVLLHRRFLAFSTSCHFIFSLLFMGYHWTVISRMVLFHAEWLYVISWVFIRQWILSHVWIWNRWLIYLIRRWLTDTSWCFFLKHLLVIWALSSQNFIFFTDFLYLSQ